MTIHHGFEDPYEAPEDYTWSEERDDFARWLAWHEAHCTDHHEPWEPKGPTVITIDPSPYL